MKKLTQLLESKFIKSTQELEAILEADENTGAEKNPVKDAEPEQATDQAGEQNGAKDDKVQTVEMIKRNEEYFFKNIIFFTNERDASKNKTLKNLQDALKNTDVNLVVFVAEEVDYTANDKKIEIKDSKEKFTITDQSNVDTIVIVRLGAQDSEECMECVKELQDWGLAVLNSVAAGRRASNKYASCVLFQRYGIPQPKFCLLSAKDVAKGEESLEKKLKLIYKEVGENKEEDEKREYVVKILDGHGGTGVFMTTGKTILSILQAIFAIDPERELLLQRKEEADGGDIRVHVLTTRTKQIILAAMKRKKLSGDFRSNVSLGAQAEKVEITEEQKEIALKTAKVSGLYWAAVDIMPLVHGSNPEVGDNVVLEVNCSAGTDGISTVIGENFCKILLDAINDINELVLAPKSIGYIENMKFIMDNDDEFELEAKFDTGNGAKASTIGCESVDVVGDKVSAIIEGKTYRFKKSGVSNPTVGQVKEERVTVTVPCIQVGTRKLLDVDFALVDNRKKSTPVLLNRDIMAKMGYMINPGAKHTFEDEFHSSDFTKHTRGDNKIKEKEI